MYKRQGLSGAIETARRSGRSVEIEPGTSVAVAAAGEEHLGTLVAHGTPLEQAERRTLERGAIVTALVLLFTRTEAEAEERVRGELLIDLLAGRDLDPDRLRERARRQGADLEQSAVVAVAHVAGVELHRVVRLGAALAGERSGLSAAHEGAVVVVTPGTDALELGQTVRTRLATDGATVTVGVAAAPGGADDIPSGYVEARRCTDTLLALDRSGDVSDPAHLGLARLLLGTSGPGELDDFVSAVLGPVADYDHERGTALVATLAAWFDASGSLRETAGVLHVHPNTVGQRLDRIASLLGDDWRLPARALDLQLALRMHRLRQARSPA